jgi:hypothetical protein
MAPRSESQRQERGLAASLGGRSTPASGAFWHRKGDVRSDRYLVEAKQTAKQSISIAKPVWEKIRREALLDGRVPVLALRIQDRDLAVLDMEDFLGLAADAERDLGEGGLP